MCSYSTLFASFPTTIIPSMKNVVGSRIRELRHRAGRRVTQEELAARLQAQGLEIDRTAISKIEAGKRPVTDVEMIAICKALDVKMVELFQDDG